MERFYLLRAAPVPVGMHQVHQVEVQDAEVAARGTLKTLKTQKSTRILCMLLCYAMLCNAMQCYGSVYDELLTEKVHCLKVCHGLH